MIFDEFKNGAALVIGGSGGLGTEICRRFAQQGSAVAFTYRRGAERAAALREELSQQHHDRIAVYAADLNDPGSLREACAATQAQFGRIHTLVFASGPAVQLAPLAEMPREAWEKCIAADVLGFFNLIQAGLPYLRQSCGSLVALSTAATQRYAPLDILSAGPKASVEQLVKAVAREEGRYGVRANGVRVGFVEAGQGLDIQRDPRGQRLAERTRESTPLRRLASAGDIANAVLFFASSMASYISGEFLSVDGGGHV